MLQVADHRTGAGGLHLGGVIAIADQSHHLVAAGAQQARQAPGDLAVGSRDRDPHR
jgi:hypothetical protein